MKNTKPAQHLIHKLKIVTASALVVLFTLPTQAYMSINETAEILPENYFKLGVALQANLTDCCGHNFEAFADAHLFEATDGRITIGGGDVDFFTQASVKWVPFPDVDRQPAMGVRGAVMYARYEEDNKKFNRTNFQIAPIISKKADTDFGDMIPYVALPVTILTPTHGSETVATQFTVGSEWFPKPDIHVGGEFNFNMDNSFNSFSAYVSFPFEASTGYKKH